MAVVYFPYMNKFNKVVMTFGAVALFAGSIPVFAEEGRMENKNATSTGSAVTATVLTCMQAAVDARDTAVIAGFDAYYPSVKTALQTRQSALKAAWAQTDQKTRRDATRAAWDAYKASIKTARSTMKAAHKAAWMKFEADRKACSPRATRDDNGSAGMDSQL